MTIAGPIASSIIGDAITRAITAPGVGGGGSPSLPVNTLAPAITGDPYIGETLTATPGTWTGADSVSGEWYVNGIATGDTDTSYEIQIADAGKGIEYRETASNDAGEATQESNEITIVDWDYYIDSAAGSDSNSGTSPASAWATLSKINSLVISEAGRRDVLVKSGTYGSALDYVERTGNASAGATLQIVFEQGCVMDGTAANAVAPKNGWEFSEPATAVIRGNGLIVRNYSEGTGASPNGFGNRGTHVLYVYDAHCDNCDDGFSAHADASIYTYNCSAKNSEKGAFIHIGNSYVEHHDCEFILNSGNANGWGSDTPTIKLFGCKISSSANSTLKVPGMEIVRCRIGTTTHRIDLDGAAAVPATIKDSYVNSFVDGNRSVKFERCFGALTVRCRTGSAHPVELDHCVITAPATGYSSIFMSNYNSGGNSKQIATSSIFKTATAAQFMSVDATNAAQLVAGGSLFSHNLLGGSAAFDADLVSADSGNTVIVSNLAADPLIGSGTGYDPDNYAYTTGSPAIGAGVGGSNVGFAVGEVTGLPA